MTSLHKSERNVKFCKKKEIVKEEDIADLLPAKVGFDISILSHPQITN